MSDDAWLTGDDDDHQGNPVVQLKVGDMPRATRAAKRLLIESSMRDGCPSSDIIFRRGSELVHLSRNELAPEDQVIREGETVARDDDYHVADDLIVQTADLRWFADRVQRSIDFVKLDKEGNEHPAEPTDKFLQTLPRIVTAKDFPQLKGTVETPTLRADWSLLTTPGYDKKSGLYFDPGRAVFPAIPDQPTKVDAHHALELFTGEHDGILKDFPFTDAPTEPKGLSLAVALSLLLTAVCRRGLRTAPLFVLDAYEPESGKTLLGHIAGALAVGREISVRGWQTTEYQRENTLAMALEASDPVLLFDNSGPEAPLTGDCFNRALTAGLFESRRLGSSSGKDKQVSPTNALMIATGNHIVIQDDMTNGRTLIVRVIPDRPYADRAYRYRFLLKHVLDNRPQYVAALLTILRAYAVAADKRPPVKFRHPEWGDLVAAAVAWLGFPDPCLAQERAKVSDPKREVQEDVVRAWATDFGDQWVSIHKLIANEKIAGILSSFLDLHGAPTFKTATPFLRDMIGIPRLGFKVEHMPGDGHHKASRWKLGTVRPGDKDRYGDFTRMAQTETDFSRDKEEFSA